MSITKKDQLRLITLYELVNNDNKMPSPTTAYLEKLKRLNPGWDPEKAKTDFENEYDEDDPGDISDHVDYEENAAEWLDNISSFTPGVKVGDWVEAYVKNAPGDSKICIGKIVGETTMQGYDYGWMGYTGPTNIPAWTVRVFAKDEYGEYRAGEPNDYAIFDKKIYFNIGKVDFIQHDEIQSNKKVEKYKTYTKQNTFTRLPNQNIITKTIK